MQQFGRAQSLTVSLRRYGIPLLVGLIIGTLTLLIGKVNLAPYELERKNAFIGNKSLSHGAIQFDKDEALELIICSNNLKGGTTCGCTVSNLKGHKRRKAINQYNVKGRLLKYKNQSIVTDYDQDGQEELGVIHHLGDSLFYSAFRYGNDEPFLEIYLDSVALDQGGAFLGFYKLGEYDRNGDGFLEVYFYLGNGYNIYPRRVYSLDLAHESFLASPKSGVGFKVFPFGRKKKGAIKVLTGTNHMPANYYAEYPHPWPDNKGYAYAFKPDLSWALKPIPLCDYPDEVKNFIRGDSLISQIHYSAAKDSLTVQYRSLESGELLVEKDQSGIPTRMTNLGNGFIHDASASLKFFSPNWQLLKKVDLQGITTYSSLVRELFPGEDAFLTYLKDSKTLQLFDENANLKAQLEDINLNFDSNSAQVISCHDGNTSSLIIDTGQYFHLLALTPDPLYPWRWVIPLGIYGGSLLLSFWLFGIFRRNVEKRYEREKRMNQLQLLSLNKQVDPHFILNALDNIDWMYRHQEWKQASSTMGKLSRLMQKSVLHSGQLTVSLYEELDFCRNYCAIEENRSPGIQCSIEVGDGLEPMDIEVPRQLLFTHVENAIKHGLRPKETGEKKLFLKLWRRQKDLHISISDTGVGTRNNQGTRGTGKGLQLLREIIKLYHKIKGVTIRVHMHNRPEGGLKVELVLLGILDKPGT